MYDTRLSVASKQACNPQSRVRSGLAQTITRREAPLDIYWSQLRRGTILEVWGAQWESNSFMVCESNFLTITPREEPKVTF